MLLLFSGPCFLPFLSSHYLLFLVLSHTSLIPPSSLSTRSHPKFLELAALLIPSDRTGVCTVAQHRILSAARLLILWTSLSLYHAHNRMALSSSLKRLTYRMCYSALVEKAAVSFYL